MNDATSSRLKIIVERAVRPVRASASRKRAMREELFAHVVGVFEEESARLGDDQAALARTALRFGDPDDVTAQLQESVPASDALGRFWEGRPDESTLRGALRFAGIEAALCLGFCGFALWAAGWIHAWSREELAAFVASSAFLPFWLFGPLWFLATALVAHAMEQRLLGAEPVEARSRLGLKAAIASAWAVPVMRWALIAGGSCMALLVGVRAANRTAPPLDWDRWSLIPAAALLAGLCAALSVACAWSLVRFIDVQRRRDEEWTSLRGPNKVALYT
ncbi:hypothetical protein [Paludisphaera mucosa]|uniref:Uncharacterized protein n=1 Tax=Paludisphaera mucosa TaxID=3030827 RepID=A0ABT6FGF3_9BACT|nr:hypothetical protein [Paludisphaera mucosa]MDG3006635.1 hypothetical protein [Paludisphaera mucosa]